MDLTFDDLKCFRAGKLDARGILDSLDKHVSMTMSSRPFTNIFDTGYYWNASYILDPEKYRQVKPDTRLSDDALRCVVFSAEINKYDDNLDFTLFVDGKHSDKIMSDMVICERTDIKSFKEKICPVLDCIIDLNEDEMTQRIKKQDEFLFETQTRFDLMVSIYTQHIIERSDKKTQS